MAVADATSAINRAANYSQDIVYFTKSVIGHTINTYRLIQEIQGKPNLKKYLCHIDPLALIDTEIMSPIPATN